MPQHGRNTSKQSNSKESKRYKDRGVGPMNSDLKTNDGIITKCEPEIEDNNEPESEIDVANDYADPVKPYFQHIKRSESSKVQTKNTVKFKERRTKTNNDLPSQEMDEDQEEKIYWDSNYGSLGRTTKSELNKLLSMNKSKIKNRKLQMENDQNIDPSPENRENKLNKIRSKNTVVINDKYQLTGDNEEVSVN